MTTMSRFLALIPVVAFAAGCNGMAPSGPSQVSSHDAIESQGDASAMGRGRCSTLKAIELTVNNADDTMLWVDAVYHFSSELSTPCAAPNWSADREGLTVDKANPYRAGFARILGGKAVLEATGPNSVQNTIVVDLNPNSVQHGTPLPQDACSSVAKVSVRIVPMLVPSGGASTVALEATYVYDGPLSTPCLTAPVWDADRIGLQVSKLNPFQASIEVSDTPTTVTATAPNGTGGSTTF